MDRLIAISFKIYQYMYHTLQGVPAVELTALKAECCDGVKGGREADLRSSGPGAIILPGCI